MTDNFELRKASSMLAYDLEPIINKKPVACKTGNEYTIFAVKNGLEYIVSYHVFAHESHKNTEEYAKGLFDGVQNFGRINLRDNEKVIEQVGSSYLIVRSAIGEKPEELIQEIQQRMRRSRIVKRLGIESLLEEYLVYEEEMYDDERQPVSFEEWVKNKSYTQ